MNMELIVYVISGIVSVVTAIIILRLQERVSKKRIFRALYSEIESNLELAQRLLPLAEYVSKKERKKRRMATYFDLQRLHTYSYEDFRRSGHLLSLNQKARELLEEVYELISSHNYQTDTLKSQKIDYSSFQAMISTLIPRTGGYSERLKILIDKLKLLRTELEPYI